MSDLIEPNIICFQTQKQLATLNNIGVLLEGVLIELHACKFVHMKTSLRVRCMHARHRACNLSSPVKEEKKKLSALSIININNFKGNVKIKFAFTFYFISF